jgi:hypothetical protein
MKTTISKAGSITSFKSIDIESEFYTSSHIHGVLLHCGKISVFQRKAQDHAARAIIGVRVEFPISYGEAPALNISTTSSHKILIVTDNVFKIFAVDRNGFALDLAISSIIAERQLSMKWLSIGKHADEKIDLLLNMGYNKNV